MQVTREQIIECVRRAVEPLEFVYAYVLGGSEAFGNADEYSDIDAQLNVDSEHVEETFTIVEEALTQLSPISRRMIVPEPAWHGHSQRFYNLQDASEYHQVDLFLKHEGREPHFDEIEHHGHPVVIFDKTGTIKPRHMDPEALREKLAARWPAVRQRIEMFGYMVQKELNRGNPLAALHFYHGFVLNPLVEALRIKYSPFRHDWGVRYAHYDLPAEVNARLNKLYFLADRADLERKYREARAWFAELAAELEIATLPIEPLPD
ncbi:hypothetical protein JW859_05050 [bacterium]|nr:hypothetical protein [bacterium]